MTALNDQHDQMLQNINFCLQILYHSGEKKKSLLLIKLEQLPRGSVKYPSLEKLKTQLYKVLRHLI